MLDRLWLLILCGLDIWALWASHELLALCASFGLLIALSIVLSRRFSLSGVTYRRRLGAERARFGEVVDLTVEIANGKILPLALLQIKDDLPRRVTVDGGTVRTRDTDLMPYLYIARAMLPYERVIRRLRVHCACRGDHTFGPARWESGDYLGAASEYDSAKETHRLLVYPKMFPVATNKPGSTQILGRDSARRWLFADPLRVVGSRDYAPGDPMRLVDWRATARRGTLMTRELEPSTTPTLQIVVNFQTDDSADFRVEPDEIEFAISVAASLAIYGCERKWHVGLSANGSARGAPIALAASSAPGHVATILELLARADNVPTRPFTDLLLRQRRWRYERPTMVVVTTYIDDRIAAALLDMRRRGQSLVVILASPRTHGLRVADIPVWWAEYDEDWTRRDALVLAA